MRVVFWTTDTGRHDPRVVLHDGERYIVVAFAWEDNALWAWSGPEVGPCTHVLHEEDRDDPHISVYPVCAGPVLDVVNSVSYAPLDDQVGGWSNLTDVYTDMERLINDPAAWIAARVL